jgi:hypothetical protein
VTGNICDSQTRNGVAFADAKIVDVSTLTALTAGFRIDRTDDFSSRDLYITITDAPP